MAPLAAPIKKERAADSHIPQFGGELPFEGVKKVKENAPKKSATSAAKSMPFPDFLGVKKVKENAPKKSGKGMLFAALVAGTALLAAGAWWGKRSEEGRGG